MFEHAFRFGMRCGSRVLFGMAAAILVFGIVLSIFRFIQASTEINAGRVGYGVPYADWVLLLGGLLSAAKEAVIPLVAAIVLERLDRWTGKRAAPETSN